jgi:polyhydroxybutyrate depolymerase
LRIAEIAAFDTIADRERFIVAYPLGKDTVWNTFSSPYHSGTDDVGFISALIDSLHADYHVNLNRVYATGMSNGGFMSYKLACALSHRIAAIAPVAGAFTDSMRFYCQPQRPMPVLHIHGTSDFLVGYHTGILNIPVAATLNYWIHHNKCPSTEKITQIPNINLQDNSTVTKYEWAPCNNQSEVVHYKINSGGHTWPGSSVTFGGLGGNVNYDINASELIWEFFNRFTLQGLNTSVNEAIDNRVDIFPNPFNGELTIQIGSALFDRFAIFNLQGQLMEEGKIHPARSSVSISSQALVPGIYLLQLSSVTGQQKTCKVVKSR